MPETSAKPPYRKYPPGSGCAFALLLVTPFWIVVAIAVVLLIRWR